MKKLNKQLVVHDTTKSKQVGGRHNPRSQQTTNAIHGEHEMRNETNLGGWALPKKNVISKLHEGGAHTTDHGGKLKIECNSKLHEAIQH